MKQRFYVLMGDYWDGDSKSGKFHCIPPEDQQEKRDGKVGFEISFLKCSPELVNRINALDVLPCVMDLDMKIKNTANGPTMFVTDAKPFEKTSNAFGGFLQTMFDVADGKDSKKPDAFKPTHSKAV